MSGADKMALPVFLMCFAAGSSGAATLQNGAMLEFRLEDTFGREVRARDYRGVPVAILCGACWCGGCQQDAGPFNDLARQFTRRGVQFIRSVSGDNSLTSLEFQKHYRLAMVNLLDPNRAFEKQYNDDGWTFIMLADRTGRVVYRANSPDMGEIATRLEDLATHSSGPATIVRDRVPYMRATLERSGEIHTSRRLDVFPSIASWPDGRLYVVFTSNRRGSSDVYLRRYEGGRWSEDEPIAATEADEFDGSVIVDQSGEVWISWTSDSGGRNYNIFVTCLDASGRLKPPTQLTRASDDAMHARLACDRSGFIWCAYYRWQKLGRASRDKEVYVRRFANGEWSLEMHVSPEDVPGYEDHTEPVMAPYEDGVVVGWSWDFHRPEGYTADAASPTIFLRAIARDFIMGPAVHASGRSIDVTPALVTDGKKSVWCAWDAGEWDNRLRVTRRSLRVCRRDLDADRPDAEEALSPQVANICTPNLVAGSGGALSAVWSQNDNGNRWVLRRAAWDPARAKWQPSEEVESEGNPRFPSATCDARGVIWVAYSADSDNGSVIRIKALSPRSR